MEIERKFLADPSGLTLSAYPRKEMSQGYLSTDPVIRIRRSNDNYILTVKSDGLLARREFETELTKEQFDRLSAKVEGTFLSKTRYLIPYRPADSGATPDIPDAPIPDTPISDTPVPDTAAGASSHREYTIELDLFHDALDGLIYAEVEFASVEEANAFTPPSWFGKEVTEDGSFTNAALSRLSAHEVRTFLDKALSSGR